MKGLLESKAISNKHLKCIIDHLLLYILAFFQYYSCHSHWPLDLTRVKCIECIEVHLHLYIKAFYIMNWNGVGFPFRSKLWVKRGLTSRGSFLPYPPPPPETPPACMALLVTLASRSSLTGNPALMAFFFAELPWIDDWDWGGRREAAGLLAEVSLSSLAQSGKSSIAAWRRPKIEAATRQEDLLTRGEEATTTILLTFLVIFKRCFKSGIWHIICIMCKCMHAKFQIGNFEGSKMCQSLATC